MKTGMYTLDQRAEANTGGEIANIANKWEKPVPFDSVSLPDFPVDCLPKAQAAFVECLSESTQTPLEMGGLLALGVLATAFQSKYVVQVREDWIQPLCLFLAAIAPPAERKSAVLDAELEPVRDYEAEKREQEREEIRWNMDERDLLEKELQAEKAKAVKGKGDKNRVRELSGRLAEFKESPAKISLPFKNVFMTITR